MSCRAIAVIVMLALLPLQAAAREGNPTIYLLLLSFGKGDQAVVNELNLSLAETRRVKPVESAGDADFIGKVEVLRGSSDRRITVTVLKRGGDVLVRTQKTIWPNESLSKAAGTMAQEIAVAVNDGDAPSAPPPVERRPPATEASRTTAEQSTDYRDAMERREREERLAASRRSRSETPTYGTARLAFLFGADIGIGPWQANSADISRNSPKGFDFTHYAPAFTRGLDGKWHGTLNLHGGWKFFNAAAFEATVQSGVWGNDGLGAGGAILVGGRLIWYPLHLFMKDRKYEVGLEGGFGWALVGGPYYDMSGRYFSLGVSGEYPINRWMGVQASYRLMMPQLTTFYLDYANDFTEPVEGFTAYWHTFTVGAVFHIPTNL